MKQKKTSPTKGAGKVKKTPTKKKVAQNATKTPKKKIELTPAQSDALALYGTESVRSLWEKKPAFFLRTFGKNSNGWKKKFLDYESSQNRTLLGARKMEAIAVITEIPARFTTKTKVAEHLGVSRRTLYDWLGNDLFQKVLAEEMTKSYGFFSPAIRSALIREALKGSVPAIKLFLQHHEEWVERQENIGDKTLNIAWGVVGGSPFMNPEKKAE